MKPATILLLALMLGAISSAQACITKKDYRLMKKNLASMTQCPLATAGQDAKYVKTCLDQRYTNTFNNPSFSYVTKRENDRLAKLVASMNECSYTKTCVDYVVESLATYSKSIKRWDCGSYVINSFPDMN